MTENEIKLTALARQLLANVQVLHDPDGDVSRLSGALLAGQPIPSPPLGPNVVLLGTAYAKAIPDILIVETAIKTLRGVTKGLSDYDVTEVGVATLTRLAERWEALLAVQKALAKR